MARTMREALAGKAVSSAPLFKDGEYRGRPNFPGASAELRVSNDANIPMKFYARFNSTDQVHVRPAEARFVLGPNSSETIHVQFEVGSPVKVTELAPLAADWTITYEFPGVPPAEINGRQQW